MVHLSRSTAALSIKILLYTHFKIENLTFTDIHKYKFLKVPKIFPSLQLAKSVTTISPFSGRVFSRIIIHLLKQERYIDSRKILNVYKTSKRPSPICRTKKGQSISICNIYQSKLTSFTENFKNFFSNTLLERRIDGQLGIQCTERIVRALESLGLWSQNCENESYFATKTLPRAFRDFPNLSVQFPSSLEM